MVRNALFLNLPKQIKTRLLAYQTFDWTNYFRYNWFVVIISLLIGIASHLFWDSFTHNHGYFVEIIPSLKNKVNLFNLQIPIFKILQHSSSLVGGLLIILTIKKLPVSRIENAKINYKYWLILTIIALTIILFRFLTGLEYYEYGAVIISSISATLIGLIFSPILINKL